MDYDHPSVTQPGGDLRSNVLLIYLTVCVNKGIRSGTLLCVAGPVHSIVGAGVVPQIPGESISLKTRRVLPLTMIS